MITVGEMRELLDNHPDDRRIILSKDIEGNGYSPLAYVEEAGYVATSTWSGEVLFPENGEDIDDAEEVLVLFPVN